MPRKLGYHPQVIARGDGRVVAALEFFAQISDKNETDPGLYSVRVSALDSVKQNLVRGFLPFRQPLEGFLGN